MYGALETLWQHVTTLRLAVHTPIDYLQIFYGQMEKVEQIPPSTLNCVDGRIFHWPKLPYLASQPPLALTIPEHSDWVQALFRLRARGAD